MGVTAVLAPAVLLPLLRVSFVGFLDSEVREPLGTELKGLVLKSSNENCLGLDGPGCALWQAGTPPSVQTGAMAKKPVFENW